MSKLRGSFVKPPSKIGAIVFLLALSMFIQANQPQSILSLQELKQLVPKIEAAEQHRYNLKIESEMWVETKADLSDPCEPWQQTLIYVSSTAWIEGGNPFAGHFTNAKVRVDVDKEVLRWDEGAAPYTENRYSMSFGGQSGRIVYHNSGPIGKASPIKKGEVLPQAPKELQVGWWPRFTGAEFSISFFFKGRNDTLSNICRWASEPNSLAASYFEFTYGEEFERAECIKIAAKGKKHRQENYWIDPARGFALLGHKSTNILEDGSEQLVSFTKVSKLKEVTPGIWWPVEASVILRPYGSGKVWQRFVYHASNVVANDPNFDESIFTVPFPEGYLIDDQVAGKKYIVGPNGKQLVIADTNEPNRLP
jgi:hypothetical protein